jgi:hypothetical protein
MPYTTYDRSGYKSLYDLSEVEYGLPYTVVWTLTQKNILPKPTHKIGMRFYYTDEEAVDVALKIEEYIAKRKAKSDAIKNRKKLKFK